MKTTTIGALMTAMLLSTCAPTRASDTAVPPRHPTGSQVASDDDAGAFVDSGALFDASATPDDAGSWAFAEPADDEDCNSNGIPDAEDIADCLSSDCDGNGVPDECDVAADASLDLDDDGMIDFCAVIRKYVYIDPRTTYLRTVGDGGALDARPINLAALGILPGDFLQLERLGDFGSDLGRDDNGEHIEDMTALFSATDTLLPSGQLDRVPDAIAAGDDYVTPATLVDALPTDVPEDFYVYVETLCVPDGARYLFVSGVDSHFGDNFDRNHDFTIRITSLPGFADCNHNGVADEEDIASGASSDINGNGVPDECETVAFDAIALEFTVHNSLAPGDGSDAVAIEFTVHNDLSSPQIGQDAVALEFTIHNDLSTAQLGQDAVAAEFTVSVGRLPCDADLNLDGFVDLNDYDLFAECMGPGVSSMAECRRADIDRDDDVDLADFAAFQIGFDCE